MAISFYNTLTRKVEPFESLEPGKIRMYVCGPTVYDYFHIGNARSFIIADIVRRYFEYRGYSVKFVMNITDIDDKIIKRANEQKVPASQIAETYTLAFMLDLKKLGVHPANAYPRATESIGDIINYIKGLVAKGMAYVVDGDVYYSVASFHEYGKLSGKKLDELQSGARVEVDSRKRDPLDFALWKAAKQGEPSWESPWGRGRPGWHIECSVMSQSHLGETFDIHGGGNDLIFPHHENEIAQSEGLTGKIFANYWMHFGFLNIDNEKMSKSLGNIVTAREFIKKYPVEVMRYFFLQAHYRSPINFTKKGLDAAEKGLQRLLDTYDALRRAQDGKNTVDIQAYINRFLEAVDDDLNFPSGLAVIFELIRELNIALKSDDGLSPESRKEAMDFLKQTAGDVFGILGHTVLSHTPATSSTETEFNALMELILEIRAEVRKKELWDVADLIRDKLKALDITIEDGKLGSMWKRGRQRTQE